MKIAILSTNTWMKLGEFQKAQGQLAVQGIKKLRVERVDRPPSDMEEHRLEVSYKTNDDDKMHNLAAFLVGELMTPDHQDLLMGSLKATRDKWRKILVDEQAKEEPNHRYIDGLSSSLSKLNDLLEAGELDA